MSKHRAQTERKVNDEHMLKAISMISLKDFGVFLTLYLFYYQHDQVSMDFVVPTPAV